MIALLAGLWSGFGGYLVAGVVAIVGVAGAWLAARSGGKQAQQVVDAQKGAKDDAAASKARGFVDGLSDSSVDGKLQQFQRK